MVIPTMTFLSGFMSGKTKKGPPDLFVVCLAKKTPHGRLSFREVSHTHLYNICNCSVPSQLHNILFVRRTQSGHRTGEGCFGHVVFLHALLLTKLLLGSCFRFFRTLPVDVFRAFCGVYQNGQTVIDHLCKAQTYDRLMPVSFLIAETKFALSDGNDTVCMMGQYGTCLLYTSPSPRD